MLALRVAHLSSEGVELPSDEGVIEGICISSNKRSPPVNPTAQSCHVSLTERWEIVQPMLGISAISTEFFFTFDA